MAPIVVAKDPSLPAYISANLPVVLNAKFGPTGRMGWIPRLRQRYNYDTPDELYEAAVCAFVKADTIWLDVGCGRDLFPSNPAAAAMLARRCRRLVGLDPSDNVEENPVLHERVRCARDTLRRLFVAAGFIEESFLRLDDIRTFGRWKSLATMELRLWRLLQAVGVAYPEACIMGTYRKEARA